MALNWTHPHGKIGMHQHQWLSWNRSQAWVTGQTDEISQSVSQSVSQPDISHSVSQSVIPVSDWANRSVSQSVNQSVSQPASQSSQPVSSQPVGSVSQSSESVIRSVNQSVTVSACGWPSVLLSSWSSTQYSAWFWWKWRLFNGKYLVIKCVNLVFETTLKHLANLWCINLTKKSIRCCNKKIFPKRN